MSRRAPEISGGTALGVLGFYVSLRRTTSTIVTGSIWELFDLTTVFYVIILNAIAITLVLFI
ncbi:MAG: hypothetical protein ACFFDI_31810 [Promethearchaeota archaeon]